MSTKTKIIFISICSFFILIYFFHDFDNYNNFDEAKNEVKLNSQLKYWLLTAFSRNHFKEALQSCRSLKNLNETRNWMPGYMIAYLLKNDLSKRQINQYQNECPFVTLRYFDATKYPNFVKNLNEYRWKPLIIDEVLTEVENVFYFDSSMVFQNQANESIQDIYTKMNTKFSKCGIRQFENTTHSILVATHPKMLKVFNVSEQTAWDNFMFSANSMFLTRKASNLVQKWKNCALEKECMGPTGSQIYCKKDLRKREYANCHRFDQSALALLTLQCSSDKNDFFLSTSLLKCIRL